MTKIIIFNDQQQTATSFLGQALHTIFKNTVSITNVNRDELRNPSTWDISDTFLFIVPPIMGESCNYNEVFTKEISQYEHGFVKQGGISWRLCAGAYHALKNIEYTSSLSGEFKKKKSSTPLISGTSFGPLKGLGMPTDPKNRFSDCIVTPVTCQIDDKLIEFGSCYGNGCSFVTDDAQIKILAQYSHNEELNPAIIEKSIGQGIVIASGIVPHYGYEKYTSKQLQELNSSLLPHETARKCFMQALMGRMAQHAVNKGVISEENLIYSLYETPKLQETKPQTYQTGNKQSGNVLFLILIAVALFAALSYAVTQSSRGGGDADNELAQIAQAESDNCTSSVDATKLRLSLIGGCNESQISYELPNGSNSNPSAPSDKSCHVFSPGRGDASPCGVWMTEEGCLSTLSSVGDRCGSIVYAGMEGGTRLYVGSTDSTYGGWITASTACTNIGADWYLPTLGELRLLHTNAATITGFSTGNYWSSTEINANDARRKNLTNGIEGGSYKGINFNVRCVRRD